MRPNRDGKRFAPGNGGYHIEVSEVTGEPVYHVDLPPTKSRGPLIPAGDGERLPERPGPGEFLARKRSTQPLIPSRDEVATLPQLARVAFAARCARRVLPAYGALCRNAAEEYGAALRRTVEVAEQLAVGLALTDDTAARSAYRAGDAAYVTPPYDSADIAAEHAARAAASVTDPDADAYGALGYAARVLFETATIDTPLTAQLRCIRRDFAKLKRLSREQKWTDDTPVPPDVFGPMWPPGVEPYWAVEPSAPAPPTE